MTFSKLREGSQFSGPSLIYQVALEHANAVRDESVKEFYPSLYVNLGHAYEVLGDKVNAQSYYQLAADLGLIHQPD